MNKMKMKALTITTTTTNELWQYCAKLQATTQRNNIMRVRGEMDELWAFSSATTEHFSVQHERH